MCRIVKEGVLKNFYSQLGSNLQSSGYKLSALSTEINYWSNKFSYDSQRKFNNLTATNLKGPILVPVY